MATFRNGTEGQRFSDSIQGGILLSSASSAPVQNCSLQDTGSPEVRVRHCNRDPDAIFNQLVYQSVWTRQVRSKKGRLLGVFTPCSSCTQQTVGIKFWMSDTGMGRVGRVFLRSTVHWWAAHWLKNGVITYLSHGQGKQGVWPS